MANLKIRGERDSCEAQGPGNGPSQPMDIGATSIPNTPFRGVETPTRSSGPRAQPNSSLGATPMKRYTGGGKA